MTDKHQPDDIQQRRSQAVKTAAVLGVIALAIFLTFIASAIIGR
jgi:hypothetical protein